MAVPRLSTGVITADLTRTMQEMTQLAAVSGSAIFDRRSPARNLELLTQQCSTLSWARSRR